MRRSHNNCNSVPSRRLKKDIRVYIQRENKFLKIPVWANQRYTGRSMVESQSQSVLPLREPDRTFDPENRRRL